MAHVLLHTYTHENMRQLNFFNGKTGTFLGVLLLHNFVGPGQYQKGPFFIFIDTLVMKSWMGPKYVIFFLLLLPFDDSGEGALIMA